MIGKISIEKKVLDELFESFWYVIPVYQRSYVWDADNIDDLLDDLFFAFTNKKDKEYFLGSLVLLKKTIQDFTEYEVLDGQQRLTTLLMMMAVIRDNTSDEELKIALRDRIYRKKNKYKGIPRDRVRIIYKIRDKVGDFIQKIVVTGDGTLEEDELRKSSEHENISISHMAKAIIQMKTFFKERNGLADFAEFLRTKCVFVYVSTDELEDAFRLFTVLNSRGTPLTNADILKSINIGAIDEEKNQEKYAKLWEAIEANFGEDFDRFLSFIRTIVVKEKARFNLLDEFEENIYDNGKGKLSKGTDTIDIIRFYSEIYDKLIDLSHPSLSNDYKNLITIMTIGLPSGDWIPPLLYFYDRLGENESPTFLQKELPTFLQKLEYKFVADWVLRKTPTERIENMNNILKAIEGSKDSAQLLARNDLFSVDNPAFRGILNQPVYGIGFARYILLKYEYLMSDNTVHLSDYKTISIEHVLPRNPRSPSQWEKDFSDDERGYWKHRLANLVLINKRKQPKLSNCDFIEKRDRYLKNRIDVFTGSKVYIYQHDKWTPIELEERQKKMLDELVSQP